MAKEATERLVHHYDTERHQTSCGAPVREDHDDHSTKHWRGVTCADCIARDERRAGASEHATASSGAGA